MLLFHHHHHHPRISSRRVYEIIAQQQQQTVAVILVTKNDKGPVFSKIIVALLNYRLKTATDIGCHFSKKRKLKGRRFQRLLLLN